MFKLFLKKPVMMLVPVALAGGISIATIPMFHSTHTAIEKSQTSNIKEEAVDSQDGQKNDVNKDLNSLSDIKNSSDNSQKNNGNTNKQDNISSANNNDTNKQIASSSQSKSNTNTKTQSSTNAISEVEIPTIHYDRTTSIYANDNITLLRVEYYINNKLTYYSVVEQFDAATKSYIEKIYQCNRVTNIDPLIRTDVYSNGTLIKSY